MLTRRRNYTLAYIGSKGNLILIFIIWIVVPVAGDMIRTMLNREKMRQRRKELGLSQGQAAELAQLSNAAQWSEIERGDNDNVRLETLGKIAAALQCDPRDLITPPDRKHRRAKK